MVKINIENLTQEQLKVILESLGYTLLSKKEILMNGTLEEDPEMNKFFDDFNNKETFVELIKDNPKLCWKVLYFKTGQFDAKLKIKLIRYASKDRAILKRIIKDNYSTFKTIAVQSEIMQLIKDDEELVIEFAKSLINNYKIEDLESYVKKLKIDKQDKELISTVLVAAKLI